MTIHCIYDHMEWSFEDEADLLSLVCDYKPAGSKKDQHVDAIVAALNQRSHRPPPITPSQVWEKLKSWYNLPLLDQIEDSKSDTESPPPPVKSEHLAALTAQSTQPSTGVSRRSLRTKPAGSLAVDISSSLDENDDRADTKPTGPLNKNKRNADANASETGRKKLTRAAVKRESESSDHGVSPKRRQKRGAVSPEPETEPKSEATPEPEPKSELTLEPKPEPTSSPETSPAPNDDAAASGMETTAAFNIAPAPNPPPSFNLAPSPPRRITRRKAHADDGAAAIHQELITPKRVSKTDSKQLTSKAEKTEQTRRTTPSPAKNRRAPAKAKAAAVPVRRSTRRK